MEARINTFLTLLKEQRASDLHLISDSPPVVRFNGDLIPLNFRKLSPEKTRSFLYEICTKEQIARFEKERELDFAYSIPDVARFRVNLFMQRKGICGVFRIIPERIETIDELGLPKSLKKFARLDKGLVLVTGPTGSGKSTTLAAIVNEINEHQQKHILTVEDPIEFVHKDKKSLISQREVGTHTPSFADALRGALREAPDVILVGELRDLESISEAITTAEKGVLVFGTLHTASAAKTIDRLIDAFPEDQQAQIRSMLSISLVGVISQQLLKTADGMSRTAAFEILIGSPALGNIIRQGKIHQIQSLVQTADRESGMISMDQYLIDLVKKKIVKPDEALKKCYDKIKFQQYIDDFRRSSRAGGKK